MHTKLFRLQCFFCSEKLMYVNFNGTSTYNYLELRNRLLYAFDDLFQP